MSGPDLLRRAECVDFQIRYADGTVLDSSPTGSAIGFWRLDSDGEEVRFFLVGSEKDHDDSYRLFHRPTADGGWEFDRTAAEAWLSRHSK